MVTLNELYSYVITSYNRLTKQDKFQNSLQVLRANTYSHARVSTATDTIYCLFLLQQTLS